MHVQFSCAGFENLICVKNKIICSFRVLNTTDNAEPIFS